MTNEPTGELKSDPKKISELTEAPAIIQSPVAPITVDMQQRNVRVYAVFDYELTSLQKGSASTPLTFLGLFTGVAGAFATVVFGQPESSKGHSAFVAVFWAAVGLSVYFAVRSFQAWRANRNVVRDIRKRSA